MHIDFEAIFNGAYIEYAESLAEWYCYQWWLFFQSVLAGLFPPEVSSAIQTSPTGK